MINLIQILIIPLALFTIITKNPVNAVISLISVFILSGLYLIILSLNFILIFLKINIFFLFLI